MPRKKNQNIKDEHPVLGTQAKKKAFLARLKKHIRWAKNNYRTFNKESYKDGLRERGVSPTLRATIYKIWPPLTSYCDSDTTCMFEVLELASENFPIATLLPVIGDIRALFQGIIRNIDTRAAYYTAATKAIQRGIKYRYTKGDDEKVIPVAQQNVYLIERKQVRETLKLDSLSVQLRIKKHQRIKKEKNTKQIPLSFTRILELQKEINTQPGILYQIMAVQLATGSRVSEVLHISDYGYDTLKRPGWFSAHKLAKKRAKDSFWDVLQDEVLHTPETTQKTTGFNPAKYDNKDIVGIIEAQKTQYAQDMKKFKEQTSVNTHPDAVDLTNYREGPIWGMDLIELQSRVTDLRNKIKSTKSSYYSAKISTFLKDWFANSQLTGHKLRAIYGNYTYDNFSHGKMYMSRDAWLAKVLGHIGDNLATAQSYLNVRIIYPSEAIKTTKGALNEATAKLEMKLNAMNARIDVLKTCGANTSGTQEEKITSVTLWDSTGKPVTMQKRKRRKGVLAADLESHVNKLKEANIPPTYSALRRLGFGSSSIFAFKKQ